MKDDFSSFHNQYLNSYIQFADTKAAIFISINGVILGYIFTQLKDLEIIDCSNKAHLFLVISIVFIVLSYYFLCSVIFPRRKFKNGKGVIFWDDVITYSTAENYSEKVLSLTNEELEKLMIQQNFHLSKTANKKYKALFGSFVCSFLGYFSLLIYGSIVIFKLNF